MPRWHPGAGVPRGDNSNREPGGYAAVDPQLAGENGAQIIAQKPFCLGPSRSDGNCVSFQPPKVRMVRVAKPPPPASGTKATQRSRLPPP